MTRLNQLWKHTYFHRLWRCLRRRRLSTFEYIYFILETWDVNRLIKPQRAARHALIRQLCTGRPSWQNPKEILSIYLYLLYKWNWCVTSEECDSSLKLSRAALPPSHTADTTLWYTLATESVYQRLFDCSVPKVEHVDSSDNYSNNLHYLHMQIKRFRATVRSGNELLKGF